MDIKARARQLKTDVPAVFLALKRKDTPLMAKILAGVVLAYALSPIDIIPDFVPVLGLLDDVILLPALISVVVRLIPAGVMTACRAQAQGLWDGGRPKRWYYAVPIVLFWLAVLSWLVFLLL